MIEILLQAEGALSVGLLDRAEDLYRQVAESDPRNAIAVVGLARVALERGDEPGALDLARRALAIDTENAAAQRLATRLEEVLALRGSEARVETHERAGLPLAVPPSEAVPTPPAKPGAQSAIEPPVEPEPSVATGQPTPTGPASETGAQPPVVEQPPRRSLVDRLLRRG
jgi:tetratricopeptide (TPR) repeat protein